MNNEKLKNIAQKVLDKIDTKNNEQFGSIITILMIISIILTVIRVLQECNKNKLSTFNGDSRKQYFADQIRSTAIKRGWFTKMMLKKAIRKEIGLSAYREYGTSIMNAILKTAEELKDDELFTLVEATNV
jgi:hypothetical protein